MGFYLVQVDPVPGSDSVMVTSQVWLRTTQPTEGELGDTAYAEQVTPPRVPFQWRARAHVFRIRIGREVARAAQAAIEILYDNEGVQVRDRIGDI